MPEFRYKGVVVNGEIEAENGMKIPNIERSIEAFGFKFNGKTYTEVPDDAVAYTARVLDRAEGKLIPTKVLVVDKLRGNREFEERTAEKAA